jgi:hypothetical protein
MKKAVWISFDLGVRGDYESLYRWLDSLNAIECGENLAFCRFDIKEDLISEVKASVPYSVAIDQRTRIYAIYKDEEKVKGQFLFGRRKSPPWAGYAPKEPTTEDDG